MLSNWTNSAGRILAYLRYDRLELYGKSRIPAIRGIKAWLTRRLLLKFCSTHRPNSLRWSILDPHAWRKWAPRGIVCFCQTKRPYRLYPWRYTNTRLHEEQCPSCVHAYAFNPKILYFVSVLVDATDVWRMNIDRTTLRLLLDRITSGLLLLLLLLSEIVL